MTTYRHGHCTEVSRQKWAATADCGDQWLAPPALLTAYTAWCLGEGITPAFDWNNPPWRAALGAIAHERVGDSYLLRAPVAVAPSTQDDIRRVCGELADMLVAKNAAYGDSALDPVRVFSHADPVEQILVRIDDKLSRLARGSAAGEDVEQDLMGYLILLRIARERAGLTRTE